MSILVLGNSSRSAEEDPGGAGQAGEPGAAAGAVSVRPPVWPRHRPPAGAQPAAAEALSPQCGSGAESW